MGGPLETKVPEGLEDQPSVTDQRMKAIPPIVAQENQRDELELGWEKFKAWGAVICQNHHLIWQLYRKACWSS